MRTPRTLRSSDTAHVPRSASRIRADPPDAGHTAGVRSSRTATTRCVHRSFGVASRQGRKASPRCESRAGGASLRRPQPCVCCSGVGPSEPRVLAVARVLSRGDPARSRRCQVTPWASGPPPWHPSAQSGDPRRRWLRSHHRGAHRDRPVRGPAPAVVAGAPRCGRETPRPTDAAEGEAPGLRQSTPRSGRSDTPVECCSVPSFGDARRPGLRCLSDQSSEHSIRGPGLCWIRAGGSGARTCTSWVLDRRARRTPARTCTNRL